MQEPRLTGARPGAASTPEAAELGRCVRRIQLGCFGGCVWGSLSPVMAERTTETH